MLMVHSRHDRDLLDEDKRRPCERDEDLTHDEVADALLRGAEIDHEPDGEDIKRHRAVEQPLEATGATDREADDEKPAAGNDVEDAADVAGLGDGEAVHDLEEGGEVAVPAVVGDLPGCVEGEDAGDGAVRHEGVGDEGDAGCEGFVQGEEDESGEAGDQHANYAGRRPAVGREVSETEGEEEKD